MSERDERALLDRSVTGAAAAHQALLAHLDELASEKPEQHAALPLRPSLLPDWTIGHVLTHLARNADSHVRMLDGAAAGEIADQYPGGSAGRAEEIEAGAERALTALIDDLRGSIWRLEQTWARQPTWNGSGRSASGALMPVDDLPFRRWRETVVHHTDLGLDGYATADWPSGYVRTELVRMQMLWTARQPMGMGDLPEQALRAEPHLRLAWLLGRADIEGLAPADVFA